MVLPKCSTYFDGQSLWLLRQEDHKKITEMVQEWTKDGLHCIVLAYKPVSDLFSKVIEAKEQKGIHFVYVMPNSEQENRSNHELRMNSLNSAPSFSSIDTVHHYI